jgi:hypothetical protein
MLPFSLVWTVVRQDSHAYKGLLTVVPTDMLWQESDGQMINVST